MNIDVELVKTGQLIKLSQTVATGVRFQFPRGRKTSAVDVAE
jgi:hypothetical protein